MVGLARALTEGDLRLALDIGVRFGFFRDEVLCILARALAGRTAPERRTLYDQTIGYIGRSSVSAAEDLVAMLCFADEISPSDDLVVRLKSRAGAFEEFRRRASHSYS
jgi:hypothetical protein